MRAKIFVVVVICIALILAACTEMRDVPVIPDRELSGELIIGIHRPIHLSDGEEFYIPSDSSSSPFYQKLVQFMDENQGVKIKVVGRALGANHITEDYNVTPDIIVLTHWESRWGMSDQLEELSFYIENLPFIAEDDNFNALMNKANFPGQFFLIPFMSDPLIVYYAEPIFNELGISLPPEDWTWDDFTSFARQLTQAGQTVGIEKSPDNVESIINMLGGSYSSAEMDEFESYINSEQTTEAFLQYFDILDPLFEHWNSYGTPPSTIDMMQGWPALGIIRSSQSFVLLNEEEKGYALAAMPQTFDGERHNNMFFHGLGITKSAQNKELAWELMRYVVGDQPLHFVVLNTLYEGSYGNREKPVNYEDLKKRVLEEINQSQLSTIQFHRVPYEVNKDNWAVSGVAWHGLIDGDVSSYLNYLRFLSEDIRNKRFNFESNNDE